MSDSRFVRIESRGSFWLIDIDEWMFARIRKDEHPGTRDDWLEVEGKPPNLRWHRLTSWEIKSHTMVVRTRGFPRPRFETAEALFIYSDVVGGRVVGSPQLVRIAPDAVVVS